MTSYLSGFSLKDVALPGFKVMQLASDAVNAGAYYIPEGIKERASGAASATSAVAKAALGGVIQYSRFGDIFQGVCVVKDAVYGLAYGLETVDAFKNGEQDIKEQAFAAGRHAAAAAAGYAAHHYMDNEYLVAAVVAAPVVDYLANGGLSRICHKVAEVAKPYLPVEPKQRLLNRLHLHRNILSRLLNAAKKAVEPTKRPKLLTDSMREAEGLLEEHPQFGQRKPGSREMRDLLKTDNLDVREAQAAGMGELAVSQVVGDRTGQRASPRRPHSK
ncbi:MAG: hypothetical protein K1060chlam5_00883 [Candidatus Anoxychlamydiales bacterium]|nr:hypothetical protein [Candidatus Anoxychlamydiales bacterium]